MARPTKRPTRKRPTLKGPAAPPRRPRRARGGPQVPAAVADELRRELAELRGGGNWPTRGELAAAQEQADAEIAAAIAAAETKIGRLADELAAERRAHDKTRAKLGAALTELTGLPAPTEPGPGAAPKGPE